MHCVKGLCERERECDIRVRNVTEHWILYSGNKYYPMLGQVSVYGPLRERSTHGKLLSPSRRMLNWALLLARIKIPVVCRHTHNHTDIQLKS